MCSGTRLCAQCLLCWVLYNPGTRNPIQYSTLTILLKIPGGRMAELYSGKFLAPKYQKIPSKRIEYGNATERNSVQVNTTCFTCQTAPRLRQSTNRSLITKLVQSPGKWVFLMAVLMNVVGTLLSPVLASVSHWWASITTSFLPIGKIGNSRLKMFLF